MCKSGIMDSLMYKTILGSDAFPKIDNHHQSSMKSCMSISSWEHRPKDQRSFNQIKANQHIYCDNHIRWSIPEATDIFACYSQFRTVDQYTVQYYCSTPL